MTIGYARLSTLDHDFSVQLQILKDAGCERIFREKKSVARGRRPELARLLEQVGAGDTVVVWELARAAGSVRDLVELLEAIGRAGARFESIAQPWINTTAPEGKTVLSVFAGIAEFERDLVRVRMASGRDLAKRRGVSFGRPGKMTDDEVKQARELLREGKTVSEVARTFGVHRATIYRARQDFYYSTR